MRRKISLILTLAAWLLATGSQWDLVQTFAWARMIAGYSQDMSLARAVEKTFAPETMCSLCHAVAAAKQQESRNAAVPTKSLGKILLVCAPRALVFTSPAPSCASQVAPPSSASSVDRSAPPVPPPRALV